MKKMTRINLAVLPAVLAALALALSPRPAAADTICASGQSVTVCCTWQGSTLVGCVEIK